MQIYYITSPRGMCHLHLYLIGKSWSYGSTSTTRGHRSVILFCARKREEPEYFLNSIENDTECLTNVFYFVRLREIFLLVYRGYISPAVEEESSVSDWHRGTKDLPSYLKVGPLCDNIYAQSSPRLQMRPHPCLALFASLTPILLRSFLQQITCIQIFKSDAASR